MSEDSLLNKLSWFKIGSIYKIKNGYRFYKHGSISLGERFYSTEFILVLNKTVVRGCVEPRPVLVVLHNGDLKDMFGCEENLSKFSEVTGS